MIKLKKLILEIKIIGNIWKKFQKDFDNWINEIASWSDLDWEESEKIFKNTKDPKIFETGKWKHPKKEGTSILEAISEMWEIYKENPGQSIENINKKYEIFPEDD